MITDKKFSLLKLTSINEARMLKRSMSNNIERFTPIKLKSLQEARNEMKAAVSKAYSYTEDSEILNNLTIPEINSPYKIEQAVSDSLDKIEEAKTPAEEEKSKKLKMEKEKKVFNFNQNKAKASHKINPKDVQSRNLSTKKQNIEYIPKKDWKKKIPSSVRGESACRSSSKVKPESKLLDFMEDLTGEGRKKLTKDQEKGLLDRLQGKHLFKFSK